MKSAVPKTSILLWLYLKAIRKAKAAARRIRRMRRIMRVAGRDVVQRMRRAAEVKEGYVGLLSLAWILRILRRSR
jgi:hypothetical protein